MAQGDFTKEEAQETMDAFLEIMKALSKKNQAELFGHANDIVLFLEAAKEAAPRKESRRNASRYGN